MAAFVGAILGWGLATGTPINIHSSCGLNISDAHITNPTESFGWISDSFYAYSNECSSGNIVYATSYTIKSTPSGIPAAFDFNIISPTNVQIISKPTEILPTRLWSTHPDAQIYPLDWSIENKTTFPSPTAYIAKKEYMDFDVVVTAYFPPNSCPATLDSHTFTIRVYTIWSARAYDSISGMSGHPLPSSGDNAGLGTNFYSSDGKTILTSTEWCQFICSQYSNKSRFLSGTSHNII